MQVLTVGNGFVGGGFSDIRLVPNVERDRERNSFRTVAENEFIRMNLPDEFTRLTL